jgi:carboxyl-terminal processing protease
MKALLLNIVPAVSISAALATTACASGFREKDPLDAKATDAATTAFTSKILENSQFAHRQLDDALAKKFLDRYLDSLDGGHLIFLQSDIDEFTKSLPTLADATRKEGDSSLAHTIFKRYMERLNQRASLITKLLDEGKFDFTSDEKIAYDRKKAPHPADMAAAKALWTQHLRYDYLQEKLGGKKEAEITKVLARRTARSVETMRKMDDRQVLEFYLEALAQVYDPHSDYMGPKQLKDFQDDMNLSFIGIGASLRGEDGFCKVIELVPGSPAARSGLIHPGDRIVGVSEKQGGEFTDLVDLALPEAIKFIRGKKDTTVFLNIIPASSTDQSSRKTISLVREEIKYEDKQAKARVIDLPAGDKTRRIGVIDLPGFYAGDGTEKSGPVSCTADVAVLIAKLKKENVTGIVLDLRFNGGGSLQEAIDLTGLFIASGPIVQTRTMDGRTEVGRDRDSSVAYDGPLVVLTSRYSASASEILAGALQDYGRAVIVGDTSTFGKGTVQSILPISRIMEKEGVTPGSDPGALKVTISKFYRPSGKSTQLEGVKADIVLPSRTDEPEVGEAELIDPLPWDTIPAANYTAANVVTPALDELRSQSSKRIAKNPSFTELKVQVERVRKIRAEKTVSLNETQCKKEKDEYKALASTMRKARIARAVTPPVAYEVTVKNSVNPGLTDLYKPKELFFDSSADAEEIAEAKATPAEDVILQEAQNILLDYSSLLGGQPIVQASAGEPKKAVILEGQGAGVQE